MTRFPMISKEEIALARELIERETRMSERNFVVVSSIFAPPPYPPLTPSTLFPAEPANPWRQTKSGRIQDLTPEDLDGFDFNTED